MSAHFRLSVGAVVFAMTAALLAASPASASSSEYLRFGDSHMSYSPVVKRRATLYGRVATHRAHSIKVRSKRSGSSWSKGSTVKTDRNGKFKIGITLPSKPGSKYYQAYDSKARSTSAKYTSTAKLTTATPWDITFRDEFSSTKLNTSKWGYRARGAIQGGSKRYCSKSESRSVKAASGSLRLTNRVSSTSSTTSAQERACYSAMKRAYKNAYGSRYKTYIKRSGKYWARIMDSGHVSTGSATNGHTVNLTKPGIVAAKIRFAKPRGQHAGFWMRPIGGGRAHEIDVVEYMGYNGSRNSLYQFMYTDAGSQIGGTGTHGILTKFANKHRPYRGYHTYSVEWDGKGTYLWRVDGHTTYKTKRSVSRYAHELIISQLASDYELPRLPRTKASYTSVASVYSWAR